MPQVTAILETALYVKDPKKAADFYREIFDFSPLLETDRLIALDVAGRSVLLLFQEGATQSPFTIPGGGGVIPGHGGTGPTHFAFSIEADAIDAWTKHLESHQVVIESIAHWPGGATSIYFRDPYQNLVELISRGFWRTY